jgi:hypothetical protein
LFGLLWGVFFYKIFAQWQVKGKGNKAESFFEEGWWLLSSGCSTSNLSNFFFFFFFFFFFSFFLVLLACNEFWRRRLPLVLAFGSAAFCTAACLWQLQDWPSFRSTVLSARGSSVFGCSFRLSTPYCSPFSPCHSLSNPTSAPRQRNCIFFFFFFFLFLFVQAYFLFISIVFLVFQTAWMIFGSVLMAFEDYGVACRQINLPSWTVMLVQLVFGFLGLLQQLGLIFDASSVEVDTIEYRELGANAGIDGGMPPTNMRSSTSLGL